MKVSPPLTLKLTSLATAKLTDGRFIPCLSLRYSFSKNLNQKHVKSTCDLQVFTLISIENIICNCCKMSWEEILLELHSLLFVTSDGCYVFLFDYLPYYSSPLLSKQKAQFSVEVNWSGDHLVIYPENKRVNMALLRYTSIMNMSRNLPHDSVKIL